MGTKFAGDRNMGCGKRVSPFQSKAITRLPIQKAYIPF
jgi:hypothetical protein